MNRDLVRSAERWLFMAYNRRLGLHVIRCISDLIIQPQVFDAHDLTRCRSDEACIVGYHLLASLQYATQG